MGIKKIGKLPETLAKSPTLGIGKSNITTIIDTNKIAAKVAGTILVIFGSNQIINIVKKTKNKE